MSDFILQSSNSFFCHLAGQDAKEFPVKKPLDIIDTNGAGDSFAGGRRQ
jgi:sugar/nucleoside kinase (ribokinase family)